MESEKDLLERSISMGFETLGCVVAMDMMMRALLERWAFEKSDPIGFLEELRRNTINGMARQGRDNDPVEALLIQHAEGQVNDTIENTKLRFSDR